MTFVGTLKELGTPVAVGVGELEVFPMLIAAITRLERRTMFLRRLVIGNGR